MSEKLRPCPYCGGYPAISGVPKNGVLKWELRLGSKLKSEGAATEFSAQSEAYEYWNRIVAHD